MNQTHDSVEAIGTCCYAARDGKGDPSPLVLRMALVSLALGLIWFAVRCIWYVLVERLEVVPPAYMVAQPAGIRALMYLRSLSNGVTADLAVYLLLASAAASVRYRASDALQRSLGWLAVCAVLVLLGNIGLHVALAFHETTITQTENAWLSTSTGIRTVSRESFAVSMWVMLEYLVRYLPVFPTAALLLLQRNRVKGATDA